MLRLATVCTSTGPPSSIWCCEMYSSTKDEIACVSAADPDRHTNTCAPRRCAPAQEPHMQPEHGSQPQHVH